MLFSLKSTQVTVKQKHQMGFMYDVLPKTCLGCGAVVVSLVDVTIANADYDTKKQKLEKARTVISNISTLGSALEVLRFWSPISAATPVRKARYVQKCK